ncbi:hypothetical protein [Halomonas daqiaonensis]|uniref:Uncharacterized protein n=1 Tax=Halomonas daqiaonensis TaxID=650850 RepID=A0A1H7NYS3_9GAMM|nr:hypothetical protein [Halomonas daqiaonensis]SEL28536.1 hypothetical protein SAMN04488129_108135 [Halomonas daqiaonensis]
MIELGLYQWPLEAVGAAGALHDGTSRHGSAAHEKRNANDTLGTDDGSLCRITIFHGG